MTGNKNVMNIPVNAPIKLRNNLNDGTIIAINPIKYRNAVLTMKNLSHTLPLSISKFGNL